MFYPVWGHAITDNICRIWFLTSDIFKREFKNYPLVYTYTEEFTKRDNKNFNRLLEILGVDIDNIRPIKQPTQFDKIILPDRAFGSGFTNEYRETIDRVRSFALKNRTSTSIEKIYYFYGRRGQIGEERLAEYFKTKGYEIIRPEKLTLDEQLNLLINARNFASTLGSCAHNSLFLRDGTETIFIPRLPYRFTACQTKINSTNFINANYIDTTLSIFGVNQGPSCYIVSEQLKNFFGDKFDGYEEEDFKTFLQYVKNSLSKGLAVNPNAKAYYEPILPDFMAQLKQREDLITAYDMPPRWEQFRSLLTYQTHAHKVGWGEWLGEDQISNNIKNKRDIQAIKINYLGHKVYYSVYYNAEEGWSQEVEAPNMAGTTGKSKAITGIKIRLDEEGAKEFDILYRVHKFDGTWTAWAKNGEIIYSYGVKLNAIQIKSEPKT